MRAKYLYLMRRIGTPQFKVGVAVDLDNRRFHVGYLIGSPVRVVRSWPTMDAFVVERTAHEALSNLRLGGEWFEIRPADLRGVVRVLGGCATASDEAAVLLARPKLTHEERRARRTEIVSAVRSGEPVPDVASRFGVSCATVYNHCRRGPDSEPDYRRVRLPKRRPQAIGGSTYEVIAALINTPDVNTELAARFGVTPQRIDQIKRKALRAGITLHPERRVHLRRAA